MARSKSSIFLLFALIIATGMVIVKASQMGSSSGSSSLLVIENTGEASGAVGSAAAANNVAQAEKEAMEIARETMESIKENDFDNLHESLAKLRENIHRSINVEIDVDPRDKSGDKFIMLEESFNVSEGGKLEINIPASDIRIRTGDSETAKIVYRVNAPDKEDAQEFFEKLDLSSSQSGDTIRMKGGKRVSFNFTWRKRVSGTAEITIPKRFNVDARTSGGDIDLGDLSGELVLNTSGGDITIGDANGKNASLRTSGGDIDTDNVIYDKIKIETSGGDIDLNDVKGDDVEVRTSGGDIAADKVSGNVVDLSSSGGDLEIDNISGKLKARTSGGNIEIGTID